MLVGAAHRVAAALSLVFLALAIGQGGRYLREHGGWDLRAGSSELTTVMLLALGFVLTFSFALLRPGRRNPDGARLTAIVWSVAPLLSLAFTLRVIVVADRWTVPVGTPIVSAQDMEEFVAAHPDSFAQFRYRVPTGVFLQSFEFLNANNVEMSGYVWQLYGPEIPETIVRGVVFPEQLGDAYDATEAWRFEDGTGQHIGWYFSGTFRQNFDYGLYPFDRQGIWLRLAHPNPERPVLLVPDLASYSDLTPKSLPGIEKEFVYGGWDPLVSGFSYNLITYNTHFGRGGALNGVPYPDLYFNLSVERDFLGPMLQHAILETAIAILLFFLLVLMAKENDVQERLGLTVFDLIVAAGGLLFALILDLNSIRSTVESQQLTYLEWFPLILIAFIVLVVLNAVLREQEWRLPFLGYTGDLVPVLAYWPALLGTLLVVTLLVFFY